MRLEDFKLNKIADETDKKPNLIMAIAICVLIGVDLIVLLLNEFSVFKIDKPIMRICMIVALIIAAVPIFLCFFKKTQNKPWVKFVSISLIAALCFFEFSILNIHATMLVVLPLILSTQYKDMNVTRIAVAGSLAACLLAPIIGYATSFWGQDGFFVYLGKMFSNGEFTPSSTPRDAFKDVFEIIIFFELPMTLIVVTFSLVMTFVTRNNIKGLESQLNYQRLSKIDRLTGLLNQGSYQELINDIEEDYNVGVIFFDINRMKETNDTKGHAYGDMLISRSAQSIVNVLDDHSYGFRIGGDEFLLISKVNDLQEIVKKQDEWKNSLYLINLENKEKYLGLECDVASGYSFGNIKDLQLLVRQADEFMYKTKQNHIR
ncbi:MAG: diguanylate cyclase [Bacilli bacterium]|nr:diguanylate cyclase [Bacilli bacterium]